MLKFSAKDETHRKIVRSIVLDVARVDGQWQDIVDLVLKQFIVKNWLHVRSLLQELKDSGCIVRDSNTRIEQFHLVKKPV